MGGDEEKWPGWLLAKQQLQLSLSGGGALRPGGFVNSPMWFLAVGDIGFLWTRFIFVQNPVKDLCLCEFVRASENLAASHASLHPSQPTTCFLKFCLLSFSLITLWFTGDWWSTRFAIPIDSNWGHYNWWQKFYLNISILLDCNWKSHLRCAVLTGCLCCSGLFSKAKQT